MEQLKAFYDKKIQALEEDLKNKDAKILGLYNELNTVDEKHNTLVDMMSATNEQQKEDLQNRLTERHDSIVDKLKQELRSDHES